MSIDELKIKFEEDLAAEKEALENLHAAKAAIADGADDRKAALQMRDALEAAQLIAKKATARRIASEASLREAEMHAAKHHDEPAVVAARGELATAQQEYGIAQKAVDDARFGSRQTGCAPESIAEWEAIVALRKCEVRVDRARTQLLEAAFAADCGKSDPDAVTVAELLPALAQFESEQLDLEEKLSVLKDRKRSLVMDAFSAHARYAKKRSQLGDPVPSFVDTDRASSAFRELERQRRAGGSVDVGRVLRAAGQSKNEAEGLTEEAAIDFAVTGRRDKSTSMLEHAERQLRRAKEEKRQHDEAAAKEAERKAAGRGWPVPARAPL